MSLSSVRSRLEQLLRPLRRPWFIWRNQILGSPDFQRWAAAFPLTRPIAQRRARRVFDLVAGFVYAQILQACVQTQLLEHLKAEGPKTLEQLLPLLAMPEAEARLLVKAAVSLGLVDEDGRGCYMLGPQGAEMLANPGIAAMVRHHQMLYADLLDPLKLLRGEAPQTQLNRYWAYATGGGEGVTKPEAVREYTELMSVSQERVAEEILDAFKPEGVSCWMDLGGGNATFLSAVARRHSQLSLRLFDLPPVAEAARERLQHLGLADRIQTYGGNFFTDTLPEGADLISLVRVVHDHNDEDIRQLLARVRQVLPEQGALLLAEPMSGTSGAEPIGDAYFGFYLYAMGRGRPRTADELRAMLSEAGFSRIQLLPNRTPLLTRVMIARP
ncbi:demethylspheroidene O-methyltransferase [Ectothiorhodosinus mongolicus]|uniref:Demethylspheroidene O-methyltransferase n=1 Tax=Ectothiorhodosinus mongolicus TaxID=233100 RepID=A0A1R3W5W1_9GAMM|nr:methyltransferase [Ectothiorhodosinus mongolicus]ULX57631.1 methyltransferase [Ectothiorhodosinus mongolicus]SIT73198.1 demethylspheroidene O-methyltransferase [Ectothiorhodosinus mongolicus]